MFVQLSRGGPRRQTIAYPVRCGFRFRSIGLRCLCLDNFLSSLQFALQLFGCAAESESLNLSAREHLKKITDQKDERHSVSDRMMRDHDKNSGLRLMDQHAPDKRCMFRSKRKRHLAVQLQLPTFLGISINHSKWYWRCVYLIQCRLALLVSLD